MQVPKYLHKAVSQCEASGTQYMTTVYYCYDPNPPKSSSSSGPSLSLPPTWSSIFLFCICFLSPILNLNFQPLRFKFIMGSEVRCSSPLSLSCHRHAIPHSPIYPHPHLEILSLRSGLINIFTMQREKYGYRRPLLLKPLPDT